MYFDASFAKGEVFGWFHYVMDKIMPVWDPERRAVGHV